jgi:preprotein translocase subunit SecG
MFVHLILALMIIGLVLLQRGKGAEAGAGFGAGASGTVFGARGTATLFSKLTAVFAALFFATSLLLAYLGTGTPGEPNSVLERAAQAAGKAPAPAPGATRLPLAPGAPAPGATPAAPAPGAATTAPGVTAPTSTTTPGATTAPGATTTPVAPVPPTQ